MISQKLNWKNKQVISKNVVTVTSCNAYHCNVFSSFLRNKKGLFIDRFSNKQNVDIYNEVFWINWFYQLFDLICHVVHYHFWCNYNMLKVKYCILIPMNCNTVNKTVKPLYLSPFPTFHLALKQEQTYAIMSWLVLFERAKTEFRDKFYTSLLLWLLCYDIW